jgi:hypothetical protein
LNLPCCFWKFERKSGWEFCVRVCLEFGWIIMYLSTPTIKSWWSQLWVMAVCHCYSLWRWQSNTLWVTLVRLWLHSFLSCEFWFCWKYQNSCLGSAIVEFSLDLTDIFFPSRQCCEKRDIFVVEISIRVWPGYLSPAILSSLKEGYHLILLIGQAPVHWSEYAILCLSGLQALLQFQSQQSAIHARSTLQVGSGNVWGWTDINCAQFSRCHSIRISFPLLSI